MNSKELTNGPYVFKIGLSITAVIRYTECIISHTFQIMQALLLFCLHCPGKFDIKYHMGDFAGNCSICISLHVFVRQDLENLLLNVCM